jgi:hypothetical protein
MGAALLGLGEWLQLLGVATMARSAKAHIVRRKKRIIASAAEARGRTKQTSFSAS